MSVRFSMARLARRWAVAHLVALVASGCGTFGRPARPASYSSGAKDTYDRGISELKSKNWGEAVRYFQLTRAKFGFSKWATLAELGIADANVGREQYSDAIDGYRTFIKDHPTHEMVQNGYVAYQIASSFVQQIPGHWFLLPPSAEKDQGPAQDALRELTTFISEYPESPYISEARKRIDECTRRLADHELYVARYYLERNKPAAAIGRLEGLLREYAESSVAPKVLLLLGRTYLKMNKLTEAKQIFERLVHEHPDDYHAKKAKLYLAHLASTASASEAHP